MLVILAQEMQGQADPWDSLASLSNLVGKHEASQRSLALRKNDKNKHQNEWHLENDTRDWSLVSVAMHIHVYGHVCTYTCAHIYTVLHKLYAIIIAYDFGRKKKTENMDILLTLKLSNLLGPIS